MSHDIEDTEAPASGHVEGSLVIAPVTVEKRPVSEIAATYGASRSWLYELLARYREEGEGAFAGQLRHIGIGRAHT